MVDDKRWQNKQAGVCLFGSALLLSSFQLLADSSYDDLLSMSFEDLLEVEVTTASLKAERIGQAPSNIRVITSKMIAERGYQSFVDIAQDLPGFDFLNYNDGGGEFTTFSKNRGMGDLGNQKILILVDGIPQNHIAFNWSPLWTYEQMLTDLDRIEIIQGPGSSLYGAQAFSGVIHFISKSRFNGLTFSTSYGQNQTIDTNLHWGKSFDNQANLSFALRNFRSDGDSGIDRYDPGGYFSGLTYQQTLGEDWYLENGEWVYGTNVPNPLGGQPIEDGFNNHQDNLSIRLRLEVNNSDMGVFYWEQDRGNGSYIAATEYVLRSSEHRNHMAGYHAYFKNDWQLSKEVSVQSNIFYRASIVEPDSGVIYTWRFDQDAKRWSSINNQAAIEERLSWQYAQDASLLLGMRYMSSTKSERTLTLGRVNSLHETTAEWSWILADNGEAYQTSLPLPTSVVNVSETAVYGLWSSLWSETISTSIGIRHDDSSEYGTTLNPRLALIYQPQKELGFKLLYGSAFRQPSILELTSEFRGNPNLTPETIDTYELEMSYQFNPQMLSKANLFYSKQKDIIAVRKRDPVTEFHEASSEIWDNRGRFNIRGVSLNLDYRPSATLKFDLNYFWMTGQQEQPILDEQGQPVVDPLGNTLSQLGSWQQIQQTAKNKLNFGFNWALLDGKLNLDLRHNYVGKRKAPESNVWLNREENGGGFTDSYNKTNLTLSYQGFEFCQPQLRVKNLFDTQYYGVARGDGSSDIDAYDWQTTTNNSGFIPAYHPQPGREVYAYLNCEF